ncbi:hypothetical protein HNY73_001600 [Argiope bruennichi]|uniref:DUF7041 domain-containing protein n=1 Tax=Argiope bruennichi TaxID=94029 RepID=A0A8T0G5D9_ARGBR|nr:hypothetical protein HNY73_001600 [Argiope bruennichi]
MEEYGERTQEICMIKESRPQAADGNAVFLLASDGSTGQLTPPFLVTILHRIKTDGAVSTTVHVSHAMENSTKFHYIVSNMDSKYVSEIDDIITNPPSTAMYETLIKQLIPRIVFSEDQRMRQLFGLEELEDHKPSQFLRYLRSLLGKLGINPHSFIPYGSSVCLLMYRLFYRDSPR